MPNLANGTQLSWLPIPTQQALAIWRATDAHGAPPALLKPPVIDSRSPCCLDCTRIAHISRTSHAKPLPPLDSAAFPHRAPELLDPVRDPKLLYKTFHGCFEMIGVGLARQQGKTRSA
jgi:hypothetical protein